jgi:histidyl-tRNA synthetase
MATDERWSAAAMQVAQTLRERGYITTFDVRGRSVQANLRDAARRGVAAVVICDERAPDVIRWYDVRDRSEQVVRVDEVETV